MRQKEDVMTEIILTFPVRRAKVLSCVWYETGNPARPLACKWVAGEQAARDPRFAPGVKDEAVEMCA